MRGSQQSMSLNCRASRLLDMSCVFTCPERLRTLQHVSVFAVLLPEFEPCTFRIQCLEIWHTQLKKIFFNVYGSVHLNNILIYIQQDATLHSLFYLETVLHVSGGTTTHHQERKQLYLQRLRGLTNILFRANQRLFLTFMGPCIVRMF